jgi:putative membrane protein
MFMWGYNWGWGGVALMTLSMLFWIGLFIVALMVLLRFLQNRPTQSVQSPDAEAILRQRYARGEIDRETFQRMRQDLTTPPTA